jgi:hypothetical protein
MHTIFLLSGLVLTTLISHAQINDSSGMVYQNTAEKLMKTDTKLAIGGYGEVHYNQPLASNTSNNGELDVHRMVMLLGYNFNSKTRFISEIEFEHVSEVYIEQAFIQHKINNYIQFRGGLLLIPMGIINEYHEPTTFNGVERPLIDQKISPTTWREIGFGFTGTVLPVKMKYQVYLVNGFNGFDGTAHLNGKDGLRGGRQKGAESFISSPNFTSRIDYFGLRGFNLGLSGYFGNTQSTLFDGLDKSDVPANASADSSVVGVSMIGVDVRYTKKGFQGKLQIYYTSLANTDQYNAFTGVDGIKNNLGNSMSGYYIEAGYNVFRPVSGLKTELIPFIRYEGYDTHFTISDELVRNNSYNNTIITSGLSLKLTSGAVLKADMQFLKNKSTADFSKVFSAGIAVMF